MLFEGLDRIRRHMVTESVALKFRGALLLVTPERTMSLPTTSEVGSQAYPVGKDPTVTRISDVVEAWRSAEHEGRHHQACVDMIDEIRRTQRLATVVEQQRQRRGFAQRNEIKEGFGGARMGYANEELKKGLDSPNKLQPHREQGPLAKARPTPYCRKWN